MTDSMTERCTCPMAGKPAQNITTVFDSWHNVLMLLWYIYGRFNQTWCCILWSNIFYLTLSKWDHKSLNDGLVLIKQQCLAFAAELTELHKLQTEVLSLLIILSNQKRKEVLSQVSCFYYYWLKPINTRN